MEEGKPRQWDTDVRFILIIALAAVAMGFVSKAGAQSVTKIAGQYDHSLFLESDGSLWGMGANPDGELGPGAYSTAPSYTTNQPVQIMASNVTAIAAGFYHSLFVKSDGSLWTMGANSYGQLGDGTYNGTNQPQQIMASNVTAIAAGYGHSLFLKSDGSLWGMGYNGDGELGPGFINNTNQPVQIMASNVTAVAAGYYHSLFLKNDGSLWGMGYNGDGELGDGNYNSTNQPQQIEASNVTAIAAGDDNSLFLKSDGSLWVMGGNGDGQLGDGTYNNTNRPEQILASNVTAIAAGFYHSLFLKSDGSLWGMGYNQYGELGDGTYATNAPFGTNQPEQIVPGSVTTIGAEYAYSLFLKSDGSLWGMGYNQYGELGDGTYNSTNQPEQILPVSTITVSTSLQIQLLGANVVLTWPTAAAGYVLEVTTNLTPPVSWTTVSNVPSIVNSQYEVTNPVSGGGLFYRLAAAGPVTGSLQVTINPPGVVSAGAEWQVDGGVLTNSGTTVSGLTVGNHTVAFNQVGGWTKPANLTVAISANQPATTNGTYVLIPDGIKPTNHITLPTAGLTVSNASYTVAGTASDNVFLAGVRYQLNGTGWNLAATGNGWTNWTAAVSLISGTNLVQAYSVDAAGNVSATNSVSFVCVLNTPLTVSTNGRGSITPNYNGTFLTIGKSYSLKAKAVSGFVFSNWTGGIFSPQNVLTNGATLKFVMQSNLWLQANFRETAKPTLTVTSPKTGTKETNALVTIVGTAKDSWKVAGVWCQLNGGALTNASSSNSFTNWTAQVTLITGTNTIKTFAQNLGGNFSKTNSLTLTH